MVGISFGTLSAFPLVGPFLGGISLWSFLEPGSLKLRPLTWLCPTSHNGPQEVGIPQESHSGKSWSLVSAGGRTCFSKGTSCSSVNVRRRPKSKRWVSSGQDHTCMGQQWAGSQLVQDDSAMCISCPLNHTRTLDLFICSVLLSTSPLSVLVKLPLKRLQPDSQKRVSFSSHGS